MAEGLVRNVPKPQSGESAIAGETDAIAPIDALPPHGASDG